MLERVMKEKAPVEHWCDANSGNFWSMIGECAPHGTIIGDQGYQESGDYLYKELMKFYDKR